MKATVCSRYGSPDVLQLEEVERPTPRDNEVLVRVHVASANAADWHILRADPFMVRLAFGLLKPRFKILGADVAGRVEAVGRDVKRFQPGDEVLGDVSGSGWGAFAEFVCASEEAFVSKPAHLSFEEAAAVPFAAVTALQGVRDRGRIQTGQRVLISGASGGVGTFAVQIAKSFGAEVTGVCSTRNVDMVRSIGADHVIDYTQGDFTQSGDRWDLIVVVHGRQSISALRRALNPGGTCVLIGGAGAQMLRVMLLGPLMSMFSGKRMTNLLMRPKRDDLVTVRDLLEAGKVVPVIDRRYPLGEVPEAIRYLEGGHARGKVVITVDQSEST